MKKITNQPVLSVHFRKYSVSVFFIFEFSKIGIIETNQEFYLSPKLCLLFTQLSKWSVFCSYSEWLLWYLHLLVLRLTGSCLEPLSHMIHMIWTFLFQEKSSISSHFRRGELNTSWWPIKEVVYLSYRRWIYINSLDYVKVRSELCLIPESG